ncbi:MAG: PAS domain-containing protein, partial [Muribaculum sp.]|nr:PAS domain-containing protein [Muribaculum sp.]
MRRNVVFILLAVAIVALGVVLLITVGNDTRGSFFIAEGLLALCLILLWVFYARLIKPINTIANGIDLLREQDFSSRLSPVGQRDADRIVEMFNGMMSSLKEERLHVREQNHFLDLLIAASPMGIMILDDHDRVMMANGAALRFLEIDTLDMVVGSKISDLEGGLAEAIVGVSQGETTTLRLSDAMVYRCSRLSFMDKGYAHPFIMIEKLTDEVMKAEKLAYEKVIRMMAHEVNNSMGGVGSVLDTAASVPDDPEMAAALEICRRRCESMSRY